MNEVIISKDGSNMCVCVLEDGKVCEKYDYSSEPIHTLGNIYIGRVENLVEGMQAAFVDIGGSKNAFLSLKDALPKVDLAKEQPEVNIKIDEILKQGQSVLVQVKKEAADEKGPRISTHITFPGKYVIIMPKTNIVTVSQKIDNKVERERLVSIAKRSLPANYGVIIRTDAEDIDEEAIVEDMKETIAKWEDILKSAKRTDNVNLLYDDYDIVYKTVRDIISQATKTIYTNDLEVFDYLKTNLYDVDFKFIEKDNIFSELGIEGQIEKIDNRKIWLNCGGYIVIDKTEALTAIDVNSGKCIFEDDLENTAFKVNMDAAFEIMKQIRLKDIGGIIVIDYIDMHNDEHKATVLRQMRDNAKKDRSKIDIKEFTALNLVEMTRKKMHTN